MKKSPRITRINAEGSRRGAEIAEESEKIKMENKKLPDVRNII